MRSASPSRHRYPSLSATSRSEPVSVDATATSGNAREHDAAGHNRRPRHHVTQFTTEREADVDGLGDDTADDGPGNVLTSADDAGAGAGDSNEADDVGKEVVTGKEF